jgi:hypothetical protein
MEAQLYGAHLERARLFEAHLAGARMSEKTIWPTDFDWRDAGVICDEIPGKATLVEEESTERGFTYYG